MFRKLFGWYRSTLGSAAIGAVLLWAALPPLGLWPLAWIAPAWWVWLARRKELGRRHPYRAVWLAGFLFWLAALHWLRLSHWTAIFGWLALSFYLAFYLPVFVALARVAVHQFRVPVILAAPVVWTGLELARGHLLSGITMASLGHTQYRWIALIQLSDLAGAYGVSFVVMLVAACLARVEPCEGKPRAFWPLLPAAAVVGAALLYGQLRTAPQQSAPAARIAIIQGSIDTEIKSDPNMRAEVYRHYFGLTREALAKYRDVDLVVWPETMFREPLITSEPGATKPAEYGSSEAEFQKLLAADSAESRRLLAMAAESIGVPLILGIDRYHFGPSGMQCFNSAVYVARNGDLLGCYDKMHPVPFGEYMPFAESFPWLQRLLPVSMSLIAGTAPAAFSVRGIRVAPNICYETVIPHLICRQVNTLRAKGSEPDVLVNLTNDGWFWGSSEMDMHLACGVFRAVECRKPLLIAANTGFSAWIDADGRIVQQGPRRAPATILAEPQVVRRTSWYLNHGDWAAGICLGTCVLLAGGGIWSWMAGRRKPFLHNG